jgi:hypothetical protein
MARKHRHKRHHRRHFLFSRKPKEPKPVVAKKKDVSPFASSSLGRGRGVLNNAIDETDTTDNVSNEPIVVASPITAARYGPIEEKTPAMQAAAYATPANNNMPPPIVPQAEPQVGTGDTFHWIPRYKLKWDDYQGAAPSDTGDPAYTACSIQYEFSGVKDQHLRDLHVYCVFDRVHSWASAEHVKDHSYGYILKHEQGHFDIAEIYARRLIAAFQRNSFAPMNANTDAKTIYESIMAEERKLQAEYEADTLPEGLPGAQPDENPAKLEQWQARINTMMGEMRKYVTE